MTNKNYSNQEKLAFRIQQLQLEEAEQYNKLIANLLNFVESHNPIQLGKIALTEVFKDQSTNIKDKALLAVSDFIIGNIFGKYRSASQFLISHSIQKLTSFLILKLNK